MPFLLSKYAKMSTITSSNHYYAVIACNQAESKFEKEWDSNELSDALLITPSIYTFFSTISLSLSSSLFFCLSIS